MEPSDIATKLIIVYRFRVDAAHYAAVISRYYRQRPFMRRLPVQYGAASLIVVALLMGYRHRLPPTGTSLAIGAATVAAMTLTFTVATKQNLLRRFKKRADFDTDVVVTLSDTGIAASGPQSERKWAWGAFPHAVRFPDGILLLRAGIIRWLPDSAIENGAEPARATALVSAKSALRRIG